MRQKFVKLSVLDIFNYKLLGFATLIRTEVTVIRLQAPTIQLDDSRRYFVEKTSIVRDEQQAATEFPEQLLEPLYR